ncbi:prepilin-type N-terminal cleavage/methylation domain-containing protein [Aquincola sp. S2]|uniref:Prepilin-type N-terminal cleavage/methylation domain-containing protein n=1 Tax=Pseudaquabacterium terrae TaxID=2732868 RepID=A0ABX2EQH6_9BURK|nr:prepilin-type N-terminal cleavage/methylation domain-containing protein [Aquabacterium terrae]NRF70906.1 prepilin-type N-terminal cleavage/methylation domain-containing protein [Aquabacterium terrae]
MARHSRPSPRGVALVEALVAMAIMAFGMLAVVGVQGTMRFNADIAKQRAEATRLAESELERIRAFSTVGSGDAADSEYDHIASLQGETTFTGVNATFRLARTVTLSPSGQHKSLAVIVRWNDRIDVEQTVSLYDVISRADPLLSGLVMAAKPLSVVGRREGRHPTIPIGAKDLGDGTSMFKPKESGTIAWVFNNATGAITHTCTGVTTASASLTTGDKSAHCVALSISAQLLSGEIRFNLRGATKDLANGFSAIKPADGADVAWVIDHATLRVARICPVSAGTTTSSLTAADVSAGCTTASMPISPFDPADASHTLVAADSEVPLWPSLPVGVELASPLPGVSSYLCVTNADTSMFSPAAAPQTSVQYFCIIQPTSTSGWGGKANLAPVAYSDRNQAVWSIGTTAGTYRTCRYTQASTDFTENVDHPKTYSEWSSTCGADLNCRKVTGNLVNQNFLVIAGTKTCPTDTTATPASGDLVNSNTRPHQP